MEFITNKDIEAFKTRYNKELCLFELIDVFECNRILFNLTEEELNSLIRHNDLLISMQGLSIKQRMFLSRVINMKQEERIINLLYKRLEILSNSKMSFFSIDDNLITIGFIGEILIYFDISGMKINHIDISQYDANVESIEKYIERIKNAPDLISSIRNDFGKIGKILSIKEQLKIYKRSEVLKRFKHKLKPT